jgi:hypothetical protein
VAQGVAFVGVVGEAREGGGVDGLGLFGHVVGRGVGRGGFRTATASTTSWSSWTTSARHAPRASR